MSLIDWFKRYGIVNTWITDQGTHSKCSVINQVKKELGSNHVFTTAYCPWANSRVERMNRDVLSIFRSMIQKNGYKIDY